MVILNCAPTFAAQRPIEISDIVGIRKIGRTAISRDGQSVAYLVVQAEAGQDSYVIRLLATSSAQVGVHHELARVDERATRTEQSEVWEDIGSNLSGGIVFSWEEDGEALVYGVPEGNGTMFFRYSPATKNKTPLWKVESRISRLGEVTTRAVGYCQDAQILRERTGGMPPDPAYRYDRSTFHFWDPHPWQDGRKYEVDKRPLFSERPKEACYSRDNKSLTAIQVPTYLIIDPLAPTTIYTPKGKAMLAGKSFDGNPVTAAWFSPDGQFILFAGPVREAEDSSFEGKSVFFVEKAGGNSSPKRLFTIDGEREDGIKMVLWAPDSRSVICIRRSLDRTRLVKFDISDGTEKSLLDTEWGIYAPRMSSDNHYLYATREKPNKPKQLCRIDLATGHMLLIDDINEQFNDIEVPPYTSIRQSNHYGDELTGYLFLPPGYHGEHRLPFVAIRGQAWDSFCDGGTGVEFPGMVMAMKGFAVLFFEPSSKHFPPSQKGNAAFSQLRFQSPLENLGLLIANLEKKGWVDRERTGIAGLSAGADLVDFASGFSKIFAVGAATTGEVYAPSNYFLLDKDQLTAFFSNRYPLPYPDVAGLPAWEQVSSSLNATHSEMPLLFQPGDGEAPMTIPQHIAWQHARLPVETYVYPDEGHVKVHPLNRYYVLTRNLQWFEFWLDGVEDPSPEFADQFHRWEQMKTAWKASNGSSEVTLDSSVATP